MLLKKILGLSVFLLVFAVFFAGSASSAPDCSDNIYALSHPSECSSASSGCADNNYALTHPNECAVGCNDNNYALTHPLECGQDSSGGASGCSNNAYALSHPSECGGAVGCADNNYALSHLIECGIQSGNNCNNNNYALTHPLECGVAQNNCDDNNYALTHPLECGQGQAVCEVEFLDIYRCSGSDRQREKQLSDCNTQWFTLDTCFFGCQQLWAVSSLPVICVEPPASCTPSVSCPALGCGNYDSCGSFCGSCPPPAVVDNAPTATVNVPSSAVPGSQFGILVSGNDDHDVSQLQLYDAGNNLLETFDCAGVQTSCSKTFTRTAPSTYSTSYTFKAGSKDNAGQLSVFVSGSGATTAAPSPPSVPPPVTVVTQFIQKPGVSLRLPLQPLFMRSVSFQDSDCIRPGESALLAVKVRNTGKSTLKGVSFTATVPEIGVRARSGPHTIKAADKLTRFLRLGVPDDAEEGSYYLRLTVANARFSRTVHRAFTVGRSC